mmetsp:Transcript_34326/g.110243  ORF Transcript_34326/g.110243 Transcript_34326/m.110243 type:complete len:348 (-) Transcript_34326:33-1076(-)
MDQDGVTEPRRPANIFLTTTAPQVLERCRRRRRRRRRTRPGEQFLGDLHLSVGPEQVQQLEQMVRRQHHRRLAALAVLSFLPAALDEHLHEVLEALRGHLLLLRRRLDFLVAFCRRPVLLHRRSFSSGSRRRRPCCRRRRRPPAPPLLLLGPPSRRRRRRGVPGGGGGRRGGLDLEVASGDGGLDVADDVVQKDLDLAVRVVLQEAVEPMSGAVDVVGEIVALGDDLPDFVQDREAVVLWGRRLGKDRSQLAEEGHRRDLGGFGALREGHQSSGALRDSLRLEGVDDVQQHRRVVAVVAVLGEHRVEEGTRRGGVAGVITTTLGGGGVCRVCAPGAAFRGRRRRRRA